MTKENEINVQLVEQHIEKFDQLNRLTSFFFTYTGKTIQNNAVKLNFWQKVLLQSKDLMADPEHQKEFTLIVEMVTSLAILSQSFKPNDILEMLAFINENTERAKRLKFYHKFPDLLNEVDKESEVYHA